MPLFLYVIVGPDCYTPENITLGIRAGNLLAFCWKFTCIFGWCGVRITPFFPPDEISTRSVRPESSVLEMRDADFCGQTLS